MAFSYVQPGNAEYTRVYNTDYQPSVLYNSVADIDVQLALPTINTLQQYGGKIPNISLTNLAVGLSGAAYEAMVKPGFIGLNISGAQAGVGLVFGEDSLVNANYIKGYLNLDFAHPARMFAVQNNTSVPAPQDIIIGNSTGTADFVQFTNGGLSPSGQTVLFPQGSTAKAAYVIASLANAGVDALDGTYVAQNVVNFNVVYP